jgi:hypothetical protein
MYGMQHGLAGLVLMAACSSAAGEIYKWVDKDGQAHYGDRTAGTEQSAEQVKVDSESDESEPVVTPEQERYQRQQKVLEVMQQQRRDKQQAKEKSEQEQKKAEAACQQARKTLADRQNAGFLYRRGKDGEREILNDAEYAQKMSEAETAVQKACQ